MCSSNSKLVQPTDINGRPVLQPATSNRVLTKNPLKKSLSRPLVPPPPPISPKLKSPRKPAVKRDGTNPTDSMNSTSQRLISTPPTKCTTTKTVKMTKKSVGTDTNPLVVKYSSAAIVDAPGSIATATREQITVMKYQRKMKIAHYGRSVSAKYDSCSKLSSLLDPHALINTTTINNVIEEKRCSFITPNSDPIYVAYHDEEWGVPVHDDKFLFELLVLTGAQVGSDWTSVLKKREKFREAFSGFDAEIVSKFTDVKIQTLSSYGIEVGLIRCVVDNSKCVLEIKKAFGSFDKYIWGFVNHKPISTNYKLNQKMPVKTSKSEAISKDMVRRGFRKVGPTIIHSFMQAAGLTNDHLTTCPRHHNLIIN
ncbi:uncharacterized protein [Rutidosis leptorrhynchoides]|uniref:uncharacterized protein n=1 Tax=Rutidosis leptorrhynchoides TaxID=125765 RepID=UPI003A99B94A